MSVLVDMTGQRWGRLTVIEKAGSNANRSVLWLCQCDCGNTAIVRGTSLRIGRSKSCGCLQREKAVETARVLGLTWGPTPFTRGKGSRGGKGLTPYALRGRKPTHGQSETPTYWSWKSMKQRCLNPNTPSYQYYGGRGITICERWMTFDNFLADMGERPPDPEGWTSSKHYWSIDRIDNEGNYEPGNVKWSTKYEQIHNRRSYVRGKKEA